MTASLDCGRYPLAKSGAEQRKASESRPVPEKPGVIDPITRFFWGLLIFSLPFTDIEFPKAARGFGLPSTYLAIVLCVFVILRILSGKENLRFLKSKGLILMFLFWAVAGLSVFQSSKAPISPWIEYSNPWVTSTEQFVQLSVALSIAFLTCYCVRTWRDFRFAMAFYFAGWVGSLFAQALDFAAYFRPSSVLLQGLNDFIHYTPWWQFLGPFPRIRLATAEASWCSDYLLCLIPFFILSAYYWKSRAWNIVNASASLIVLFASMSFGGLAVFLGEAVLMALALGRRAVAFLALAGAAPLLLALTISPIYVSFVWNRAVGVFDYGIETSDASVRERSAMTETGWYIFKEHPWLGVGIGNDAFYVVGNVPTWAVSDPEIKPMFNSPAGGNISNFDVQILSETGLVGAGLFLALLTAMALGLFRAYLSAPERWKKAVYAAILIALLGQVAHYVSVNRFFSHYWFFVWGLAICVPRLLNQKDPMMPAQAKPRQIKMVL